MPSLHLGLPGSDVNTADKTLALNTNMDWVDALLGGFAVSATTTVPPGSPAAGDVYLVPGGGSGAFSGQAGKVAQWTGSSWVFYPATIGPEWLVQNQGYAPYFWNGTTFAPVPGGGGGGGGFTLASDPGPTLTADMNANQKQIAGARLKDNGDWTTATKTWDKLESQIVANQAVPVASATLTLPNNALRGATGCLWRIQSLFDVKLTPQGGAQMFSGQHGAMSSCWTMGVRLEVVWQVESNASGSNAVYKISGYHRPG